MTFQQSNLDFDTVISTVGCCIDEVAALINFTGTRYMMFLEKLKTDHNESIFEGHTIVHNSKLEADTRAILQTFLNNLLCNLKERFSEIEKIKLFQFLLPHHCIPDTNDQNFSSYGNENIRQVHEHFLNHSSSLGKCNIDNSFK